MSKPEGVAAIRGPLSSARDRTGEGEGVRKMNGWVIAMIVAGVVVAGSALLMAMLKSGAMADDSRWRAMGLDPEHVRNDEEIAYLKDWAEKKRERVEERASRKGRHE